jgi:hypothetical protein
VLTVLLLLIQLAVAMQMVAAEVTVMFAIMMMMIGSWRSLVDVPLRKRVIDTSFRNVTRHTSHVTRHTSPVVLHHGVATPAQHRGEH